MKNNNLKHFKFFHEECDMLCTPVIFHTDILMIGPACYIFKINKIFHAKTPKTMKIQIKSTENIFSADSKSTMNFQKSPETRYQLTLLFKNPKNINIVQL